MNVHMTEFYIHDRSIVGIRWVEHRLMDLLTFSFQSLFEEFNLRNLIPTDTSGYIVHVG